MKSLVNYIKDTYVKFMWPSENVYEMATISKNEYWNGDHYKIAVHGPQSGDRENPHIHIYLSSDSLPYNNFNFEISLVDLLCKDEINLIYQRDIKKHIKRTNRLKCTWDGYTKIKNEFEDWLFSDNVKLPGNYINNLDAIIWNYNNEAEAFEQNPLLKYLCDRNLIVLKKYHKYFSENDKKQYIKCFNDL